MQINSVRGARGVQMEDVWGAADAVLQQGERPTIERVRFQLGRGSPNTVGPMLDSWYATLGKRLQTGGAPFDPATGSPSETEESALPPAVLRAAKTLWGRAQQNAQEAADAALETQKAALQIEVATLEEERVRFAEEKRLFVERKVALEAALQAKDQQIIQSTRQQEELQRMLNAKAGEAEALQVDLSKQRAALEAMRQFTQAKDEEHRKERERIETRSTAQERRLLSEVDRARQAAKQVESQLESAQKQFGKALAEAEERIELLDQQTTTLQEEGAKLKRELQTSQEALAKALEKSLDRSDDESSPGENVPARPSKLRARAPKLIPKTRLKRSD